MVQVHEEGMQSITGRDWLACSPDEIALLNVQILERLSFKTHEVASVGIETSVVSTLLVER